MTTAIIRKLRSGGAVFELPTVDPFWFADWRAAVAEAEVRGMEYRLLESRDTPLVSVLVPAPSLP